MLNNVVGLITIIGGGAFFVFSMLAICDESLYKPSKPFLVFILLILAICSMITGYKTFLM